MLQQSQMMMSATKLSTNDNENSEADVEDEAAEALENDKNRGMQSTLDVSQAS